MTVPTWQWPVRITKNAFEHSRVMMMSVLSDDFKRQLRTQFNCKDPQVWWVPSPANVDPKTEILSFTFYGQDKAAL